MNCDFCNRQEMKSRSFIETKNEYCIYSNIPLVEGHSLVIPKKHVISIRGLSDNDIATLFKTVRIVAKKLNKIYKAEGMNFAFNEGAVAGQRIPHLHIHILPRKKDDMKIDPRNLFYREERKRKKLNNDQMNEIVGSLKKKFKKV